MVMRLSFLVLFSFFSVSLMAKTIFLFDVDGTLTMPRQKVEQLMLDNLKNIKNVGCSVGLVGGSDLKKIQEQMGSNITDHFYYVFSENGLVAFKGGQMINRSSIKDYLTEKQITDLINFCLRYISLLDLPCKRGTFIEFRNGMINVSPVGRNCSQEERIAFNEYDQKYKIRETMVKKLQNRFKNFKLTFSIGGQISIDIFPQGWDKTYCLQFLKDFDRILFFGDKTMPGGNDYEIYSSSRTIAETVSGPHDTIKKINDYLERGF
jgi:phosphomannomutase